MTRMFQAGQGASSHTVCTGLCWLSLYILQFVKVAKTETVEIENAMQEEA